MDYYMQGWRDAYQGSGKNAGMVNDQNYLDGYSAGLDAFEMD